MLTRVLIVLASTVLGVVLSYFLNKRLETDKRVLYQKKALYHSFNVFIILALFALNLYIAWSNYLNDLQFYSFIIVFIPFIAIFTNFEEIVVCEDGLFISVRFYEWKEVEEVVLISNSKVQIKSDYSFSGGGTFKFFSYDETFINAIRNKTKIVDKRK
jgi:hypothetical protein